MAMAPAMRCSRRSRANSSRHVRASDVVGRLGGDEFGVLLWHVDEAQAAAKARELEAADRARSASCTGRRSVQVGASVGCALLSRRCHARATIIDAADRAMYARKDERRGLPANCSAGDRILRNDVRRELIFDTPDLVAQHQLALLQPLHLDQIGTRRVTKASMAASRSRCSCSRRASCSRNARSSSSVIATAGLLALGRSVSAEAGNYCVFHKAFKRAEN